MREIKVGLRDEHVTNEYSKEIGGTVQDGKPGDPRLYCVSQQRRAQGDRSQRCRDKRDIDVIVSREIARKWHDMGFGVLVTCLDRGEGHPQQRQRRNVADIQPIEGQPSPIQTRLPRARPATSTSSRRLSHAVASAKINSVSRKSPIAIPVKTWEFTDTQNRNPLITAVSSERRARRCQTMIPAKAAGIDTNMVRSQ